MDGILIIDKPAGLTSHDVVARVRRALKEKRVGHTGTLDPFATGLLVVMVGRATRLAQFLNNSEKEYEGVIRFGYATDTGDSTGEIRAETKTIVTSREFAQSWDRATIENALAAFHGKSKQVPPMHSAKKIQGQKLYEMARRGEVVKREPVEVSIYQFAARESGGSLIVHNSDGTCDLAVHVVCSAGTYIRTLAEDVGERLGVAAHLGELHRTRAGQFHMKDAIGLAALDQYANSMSDVFSALIPLNAILPDMRTMRLKNEDTRRVRHGATVPVSEILLDGEYVQMCDQAGELIAIGVYDVENETVSPRVVFATED